MCGTQAASRIGQIVSLVLQHPRGVKRLGLPREHEPARPRAQPQFCLQKSCPTSTADRWAGVCRSLSITMILLSEEVVA
ncbi:hypothetical protein NDU88_000366 [Pleurodeles waltl]|uniref:Uncharacterized protein n=1 Tax=Pleurodeles waltl TaxID=8319 RepID=A0AAV7VWP2_PLEWA|nr:hypothetical protein NDU88_000366 [Pleurodeles waltl]